MPVDQFITGAYENALQPGEMLEGIRVPRLLVARALGLL